MQSQMHSQTQSNESLRARISPHIAPLLLWTLLWSLFFLTLLLGQERLPSSDFSGQFHAFGIFQAQEMLQGNLPLWSPGSYGGFPFAADVQAAAFYPVRWLTILLSAPSGFSYYALELEGLLHIWLAGSLTYALAFNITRNRLASLISAAAFGLGGFLTSFPLLQLPVLETISWLPLVLLMTRLGVKDEICLSRRYLTVAGLILGLSFLAGHPQTFLHCAYLSAAYYLFLTVRAGWSWRAIIGFGLMFGGTAIGLAAVSWLPAAHFTTYATRSDVSYGFISGGLPLLDYLQFLVPGAFSFWVPEYMGLATFVLALLAIFGRKFLTDDGKAEVVFWTALALIAGWLALGDAGVLFKLAYRIAPGFSLFRQQERLLGPVTLALALLGGQGAALWFRYKEDLRPMMARAGLVVLIGMGVTAAILIFGADFFREDWGIIWIRQAALLIPVFFFLGVGTNQQRQMLLLFLFLGLDLYAATYEGLDRNVGSSQVYWPHPQWLQELQAELDSQPLARIDSRNLFHANIGPIYDLEDMHGISPLKLEWLADFERLPQQRRMELMGVSHILAYGQPDTPVTQVGTIDEGLIPERPLQANIYHVDNYMPRAWMSYQPQLVGDEDAAWAVLNDLSFDAARKVVLHTPVPQLEIISPPDTPPQVETIRPTSNSLQISVETAAPGLLVISEWRYPGWQAFLDGERVDTYPADYALQAVLVPAGEHTVELRFRPLDVTIGGLLSILTLLASAILVFVRRPEIELSVLGNRKRLPLPKLPELRAYLHISQYTSRSLLVVLLIILLAFVLRIHNLGLQELRGDEAFSYAFVPIPFSEVLPTLISLADIHTPLHYLFLNVWTDLAGDSEFAMRYMSLIPAILAIPLFYLIGKRVAGKNQGILFIFFITISQSLVWLSQDVRNQYMLAIFFLALATLLLVKLSERSSWRTWFLYTLVCILAMYSHYYSLFPLLAHGLYLIAMPAYRHQLRRWLIAGAAAAIFFLPWVAATIKGVSGQLSDPSQPDLAKFLTTVGIELTVGPAFDNFLGVWLFLGAVGLVIFGWWGLRSKKPGWAALLGGWIGLTTFGIFLILLRRATFNAFYISVAAPAWWLLLSLGLTRLWQNKARFGHWLALFGFLALVAASFVSLNHYYSDPLVYGRSSGLRPLTEYIAAQWQPGDILVANFPDPSITYYLRGVQIPRTLQPVRQAADRQVIEDDLEDLANQYERIWFIPFPNSIWDPENIAFDWLDYNTMAEQALTFDERSLFAFRSAHSVEAVITPIEADLNGNLRMAGFYVTQNGHPLIETETISFGPGDEIAVTLIWDTQTPVTDDYTVFVHLLAENGNLIAQHDGTPLFGTRPTSTWLAGERLLDRHIIQIPIEGQGGNGRLVAGMYLVDETGTVIRQLFNGDQDAVPLQ